MLSFLHTSASHIPRFTARLSEIDSDIPAQHIVDEDILARIQTNGGLNASIEAELREIVAKIAATSTHILCTCSTIGGFVESLGHENLTILRVDRPMAEKAVALGKNIVVLATFPPTLEPTCELIQSAVPMDQTVNITTVVCKGAWDYFLAGDMPNYYQSIVDTIGEIDGDVIVLAQASMASVLDYDLATTIPILSSPVLGVEAIVNAYISQQNR